MPPTFSIITPSYNQLEWLKLCAASIADQQGATFEHIIQDACTGPELEEWAKTQPPHVKLFVEKDSGMYDAVNRGLRRAQGEILAYLNCDEQYLPDALNRVYQYFIKHPDVDVIFGDVLVIDNAGDFICHRKVVLPQKSHTRVCHLNTFTCATFFRKTVIENGFYFDPSLKDVGDADWILRLLNSRISMNILPTFTSVFSDTGKNMSVNLNANEEKKILRSKVPLVKRYSAGLLALQHRFRKLMRGCYWQKPFSYAIYTLDQPSTRKKFHVEKTNPIWTSRFRFFE